MEIALPASCEELVEMAMPVGCNNGRAAIVEVVLARAVWGWVLGGTVAGVGMHLCLGIHFT